MNEKASAWRSKTINFRSGVSYFSHTIPVYSWRILIFVILLMYVPFLGDRVVRPAGDDKVYVSQAIEMAAQGNWFLQTMANEPNYYKGPLHYIFLRVGMIVFGNSIWATLWMNLVLLILGALALGSIVHRHMKEYDGWAFFVGMAFASSVGIYSHTFASQMEVEMAAFFAIGAYLLDRAGPGKRDVYFWIVAGLAGCLKSPLHALLMGFTAIIFWAYTKELWPRMKDPRAWGAAFLGVLVCAAGYAPPFLLDRENFWNTYILRETLWKPANGAPWHYPIIPLFTYSLFPWVLPALVAYVDGISRFWRRQRAIRTSPGAKRVQALGLALVLPSVLFFLYHPYRGQNYNLPAIGGLLLVIVGLWATRAETWNRWYSISLALTSVIFLAVPVLLTLFTRQFDPMPFWWPSWLLAFLWFGCFLAARGFFKEGVTFQMARPASLSRRVVWFYLPLGFLISVLGEREMIDIRDRIYQSKKENETLNFSYYNLQRNIWSEWGYLNFQVPYPVKGVFTIPGLVDAVKRGETILVPGDNWLEQMKEDLAPHFPEATWDVQPWRRWKTKGKNAEGVPVWRQAWDSKDLSKLEKHFYFVKITPKP